jgi:polyisoprenoid-binding protein YceI
VARYHIDPTRSRFAIDARSSVHPIHAETTGLEGWVELAIDRRGSLISTSDPAGHVELRLERLRSDNALEDRELRRRIDLDRYPVLSADLASLEPSGAGGSYLARGDVTFRGVTRSAVDTLELASAGDGVIRLQGSSVFDIRDFGMKQPRLLLLKVEPDIKVTLEVVARRATGGRKGERGNGKEG